MIENNFVGDRLCLGVKDDPKLAMLFSYSLGGCTTIWGQIDDPEFDRRTWLFFSSLFTVFFCHLGMLVGSVLISFSKSQILLLAFFLKVEVGWAALIDDALDVITVFFRDVGRG